MSYPARVERLGKYDIYVCVRVCVCVCVCVWMRVFNMHQVGFVRKREVFCMNEMHAEQPFPCDCVTSGNGYCKRVMKSTAESKRVFFLSHKLHTKNEDERSM